MARSDRVSLPASITTTAPFMKAASSLAMNRAALAMSRGNGALPPTYFDDSRS